MNDPTVSKTGMSADAPPQSVREWAEGTEHIHETPKLLSLVANEIHPPIEGILETVVYLLETDLTGEQRILTEKLQRSGNALLTTINNLLDFSRIEAGEMRLQSIDFDLHNMLAEVKRQLDEGGWGEGPKVTCLVHYDVPALVHGDPGRLRQILSNFLPFALQLTGGKEAVLRARLIDRAENEVTIRFEVTQDVEGAGVKDVGGEIESSSGEAMEYARLAPGPGLGFAICKRMAGLMGGKFGADSESGKAGTVWFSVRLRKPPERSVETGTPRTDLRGLSALAVVDKPSAHKNLLAQTLSWGMSCDIARDASQALAMLHAKALSGQPYDLAILDMQIPGSDGLELARAIQSDPAISAVRPVALIALGLRGHAEESRQAGIVGYLTKPVGQSEFYHCLTTVMGVQDRNVPAESSMPAPLVTSHSLTEARSRSSVRVLVAEDNVVNQMVAVRMLEKLGVKADLATDGREAVEACARTRYDLILMDCQMPEMDGFEATRAILELESARGGEHIPIVAVTAHAMKRDREKCLAAGMDDYISKPFDLAQVRNLLARWAPTLPCTSSERDSSPGSEKNGPVDIRALESLRARESDGVPHFLNRVVAQYLREAKDRLAVLHEAGEKADAAALLRAAHSLKGSSGVMGAKRIAGLCSDLEVQVHLNEMKVARVLILQLEEEFDRVREELQAQALR
jgi:CheY-like chemotaxis protein/HPt (histidine-containing phosphotransfer) domain-containing protein